MINISRVDHFKAAISDTARLHGPQSVVCIAFVSGAVVVYAHSACARNGRVSVYSESYTPAVGILSGRYEVMPKALLGAIKSLAADGLELESDGMTLWVAGGDYKCVVGQATQSERRTYIPYGEWWDWDAADFSNGVDAVCRVPAPCRAKMDRMFSEVLFESHREHLRVFATDSHRMSMFQTGTRDYTGNRVSAPASVCSFLRSVSAGSNGVRTCAAKLDDKQQFQLILCGTRSVAFDSNLYGVTSDGIDRIINTTRASDSARDLCAGAKELTAAIKAISDCKPDSLIGLYRIDDRLYVIAYNRATKTVTGQIAIGVASGPSDRVLDVLPARDVIDLLYGHDTNFPTITLTPTRMMVASGRVTTLAMQISRDVDGQFDTNLLAQAGLK